ncbi:hypothetical protein [Deinococcus sp. SL84]|uniref:hypothetical protein n=1 Tax=Deinococcus sp. SL84 TaxID=2994663 RepID=UPI002275248B|nr:hypothetical protein [Deinococcus sp. SL84]MCY1702920.1 hypothetical protein [Deinococcus sp. SL84]
MKKLQLAIGLLGLLVLGEASAVIDAYAKPSFAGTAWYSSGYAVRQKMESQGFTFVRKDSSSGANDFVYMGKLLGNDVRVDHLFNNRDQLVKTPVTFNNSYDVLNQYNLMKRNLEQKYGKGIEIYTVNKYSTSAYSIKFDIERGEKILYGWKFDGHNYFISLSIEKPYTNGDSVHTTISYESPAWDAEFLRRQANTPF